LSLTTGCLDGAGMNGDVAEENGRLQDDATRSAWQKTLEKTRVTSGFDATTLGICGPKSSGIDGCWVGVSGVRDRVSRRTVTVDDMFRIGSVTKTFVATLILQLVEDGVIRLDDTLARWGGFGVPRASEITVQELLSHTSGLGNYTSAVGMDERSLRTADGLPYFLSHMEEPVPDETLLQLALHDGRAPKEGRGTFYYANTNYWLLGKIIQTATGRPWQEELHRRVLTPLEMSHTFVSGYDAEPSQLVSGYGPDLKDPDKTVDVTSSTHPSWVGAAGAIVSNATDLLTFGQALFHHRIIGPASLATMTTPLSSVEDLMGPGSGTVGYGLGIFGYRLESWTTVGHGGTTNGYESWLSYLPKSDVVIVSVHSTRESKGSHHLDEASAWLNAHGSRL
jgi:D-alanyl-D-alanine carboxypeptidase